MQTMMALPPTLLWLLLLWLLLAGMLGFVLGCITRHDPFDHDNDGAPGGSLPKAKRPPST